jgi:hypothetical protein
VQRRGAPSIYDVGLNVGGKNALLVGAAASILALTPVAPASASGGNRVLVYKVVRANGFLRADFQGDQNDGCQQRGVCGYWGAVAYQFGGTPRSAEAFFLLDKRSGFVGGGNFRTNAVTLAKVNIPGSDPCTDSVPHSADNFQFLRRGTKVTVVFHNAQADMGPDYLNTRCPGPGEVELTFARALPTGTFPVRSFKARNVLIHLSGRKPFTGGGFSGVSTWDVVFSLQQARSARGGSTSF